MVDPAPLEERLILLLKTQRSLMLTELVDAFADCKWSTLFTAIRTLSQRQQVELIPIGWDYRMVLRHEGVRSCTVPPFMLAD